MEYARTKDPIVSSSKHLSTVLLSPRRGFFSFPLVEIIFTPSTLIFRFVVVFISMRFCSGVAKKNDFFSCVDFIKRRENPFCLSCQRRLFLNVSNDKNAREKAKRVKQKKEDEEKSAQAFVFCQWALNYNSISLLVPKY